VSQPSFCWAIAVGSLVGTSKGFAARTKGTLRLVVEFGFFVINRVRNRCERFAPSNP
jgi:hypothetical protein